MIDKTIKLKKPRGAFSRVRVCSFGGGRLMFVSGVAASVTCPGSVKEQCLEIFGIIGSLLEDEGASLRNVVKITAYLRDMQSYPEYNVARNSVFEGFEIPPASTAVEAKLVENRFLVEIEAIAITRD